MISRSGVTILLVFLSLVNNAAAKKKCWCKSEFFHPDPAGNPTAACGRVTQPLAEACALEMCGIEEHPCEHTNCKCDNELCIEKTDFDCRFIDFFNQWVCAVFCFPEVNGVCLPTGDAKCDPHMNGFDGSKFNFYGKDSKKYVIYGRPEGDVVTAEMRKAEENDHTFFEKFGLQIADSNAKIEVALKTEGCGKTKYCLDMTHKGAELTKRMQKQFEDSGIKIKTWPSAIVISTPETTFKFQGRFLGDDRRYLNIEVKPVLAPSADEKYLGVLGMTLNRFVGHETTKIFERHLTQEKKERKATAEEFDRALQNSFEVSSLFPERDDTLHSMHAIEVMSKAITHEQMTVASVEHVPKNKNRKKLLRE